MTTYLESSTPICLFTTTLYGVPMKNKGCLLMRPLMLKVKSSKNFVPKWPNFGGFRSLGVRKVLIFTAKGTSMHESTSFKLFCVEIGFGVWPPGRLGKNKVTKHRIFHIFTQKPRCSDRHQICFESRFPGRNQLCQISLKSVQGFWFRKGSKFGLSHRNEVSALTQGLNYRSACDVTESKSSCTELKQ